MKPTTAMRIVCLLFLLMVLGIVVWSFYLHWIVGATLIGLPLVCMGIMYTAFSATEGEWIDVRPELRRIWYIFWND